MRASDLRQRPARPITTAIELRGQHAFTVTFDASRITRRWARDADAEAGTLYGKLCEVLIEWDLTNDDGTPYPLTADALFDLDLELADDTDILRQIIEAAVPGAAEGNASRTSTSTPSTDSTVQPAAPQNGTPTLPSPTPSASLSPT